MDEVTAGGVTSPSGFRAHAVEAGIKPSKRPDLALVVSDAPAVAGGVFTTNQVCAYNVIRNRRLVSAGRPLRAVLVNAGNANVATGEQGQRDTETMAALAAGGLDCSADEVAVAQTGVIGVPMPMAGVRSTMSSLCDGLTADGGERAARAIMTTDTTLKQTAVRTKLGRDWITIGAMAKGSGMIHPNMATLLCFVTTDAALGPALAQQGLAEAVGHTLNAVTVDGDQSTSDTCLLLANGAAQAEPMADDKDPRWPAFRAGLRSVLDDMARAVARDGEGAQRLIVVQVRRAASEVDARRAARAVAGSNLLKCAVHGRDPNWGRIACAVGYSGATVDPHRLSITLQHIPLMVGGEPKPFDAAAASLAMGSDEVLIEVDLGLGTSEATSYGCDLSEAYVSINADYTT